MHKHAMFDNAHWDETVLINEEIYCSLSLNKENYFRQCNATANLGVHKSTPLLAPDYKYL